MTPAPQLRIKMGTCVIPEDTLKALATGRLTRGESQLVCAICSMTAKKPGRAVATVAELARAMKRRKDKTADLVRHCAIKGIITVSAAKLIRVETVRHIYEVSDQSSWAVPG